MKLMIHYDAETDTLSLWNGEPANEAADVAENLVADFDDTGDVVGFTLEHAMDLLRPVIANSQTETTIVIDGPPKLAYITSKTRDDE